MSIVVKITDGGAEYPFIRMDNTFGFMKQKYVYEDSGEQSISVDLATLINN